MLAPYRAPLLAGVLTLLAFVRLLPSPLARVVGRPEGELRDHLWVSWMLSEGAWWGPRGAFSTQLAGFPTGIRFMPLDPLHQLVITILSPLLGVPGAVNVVAAGCFFALVLGAQRLAAALGGGVAAQAGAAVLAASAPPFLGGFADTQTEGMAAGWLLLLVAELAAERPRGAWVALWGAVLLATGPYLAHGVAGVAVLTFLARRIPWRWAAPVVLVALALGVGMLGAEGGKTGRLTSRMTASESIPRSISPEFEPPPPLSGGVVQGVAPYPTVVETGPRRWASWSMLAMVALAAVSSRRALGWAALAALYAALSLGSEPDGTLSVLGVRLPAPYAWFYRYYPLGAYAWKPAQYAVPATVFSLGAIAAAAGSTWAGRGRLRALLPGVFALGTVGSLVESGLGRTPLPLPASTLVPREAWLTLPPSKAGVIEYPCRERWVPGSSSPPVADALLGPLFHGRPLGWSFDRGRTPVYSAVLAALEGAALLQRGPSPPLGPALAAARGAGFGELLILESVLPPEAARRLAVALEDAGVAGSPPAGGVSVWTLGAPPATARP